MTTKKIKVTTITFMLLVCTCMQINAQVKWKRNESANVLPLQLFHSQHSINLPTAEMLQKGAFEFEISHRFLPSINGGFKDFFGFDGPVNIRLALGYAVTDNIFIALGRSNVDDNIDLRIKYRLFQYDNDILPLVVGARGGVAWNSDPIGKTNGGGRDFQYYGQLIFNTMIDKKLGIGLVPSYLYNSNIYRSDIQDSFTMGINLQYYVSHLLSVMAEFNPTVSGYRNRFDSFSAGIELETGGHFFKIIVTNNSLLNPSQFLSGADRRFEDGAWQLGFNITRLLKF